MNKIIQNLIMKWRKMTFITTLTQCPLSNDIDNGCPPSKVPVSFLKYDGSNKAHVCTHYAFM